MYPDDCQTVTIISAQNAVLVPLSQDSLKNGQLNLLDIDTSAVLKINCQITPSTTPPIRLGTKKNVRRNVELRNLAVTSRAKPKATTFTATSETTTNLRVKPSVDQKTGSLNYLV
jgi:hypothetical protein